jgi:AraC family transcriptional regulator
MSDQVSKKSHWIISKQEIFSDLPVPRMAVNYEIRPSNEIETPPYTYHLFAIVLNQQISKATIRINEQEYEGSPRRGDLWSMQAGTTGLWHWKSEAEVLLFAIEPNNLRQTAAENEFLNCNQLELMNIAIRNDQVLLKLGMMFQKEMQNKGLGSQLYLDSLANLLEIHLIRHYTTTVPGKIRFYPGGLSYKSLEQVLEYIHFHLDRSIQLSDLATIADISQYHFIRMFQHSTGMTPHQYLLRQRIERAKQLLKNKQTISEVAYQCGFSSQSHFGYHFKKALGISPKQFQKQY